MTIYCFDLDGTLCETDGLEYAKARPIIHRIERLQRLEGAQIVIDTARGSGTGEDYYQLTIEQLHEWGVPWDRLRCGEKPYADIYIDDRGMNVRDWERLTE